MSRKRLVGKPVLIDKLKPELGAEIVDRLVALPDALPPSPERRSDSAGRARRRARPKKER